MIRYHTVVPIPGFNCNGLLSGGRLAAPDDDEEEEEEEEELEDGADAEVDAG
jgi:hypothetical protein